MRFVKMFREHSGLNTIPYGIKELGILSPQHELLRPINTPFPLFVMLLRFSHIAYTIFLTYFSSLLLLRRTITKAKAARAIPQPARVKIRVPLPPVWGKTKVGVLTTVIST